MTVGTAAKVLADWKRNGARWLPLLNDAEARYGIPHDLLARQAYQESHFRDDIISGAKRSPAGAVGIMQIVPKWHPEIGETGALDPPTAIDYAARFLSSLYKRYGSWSLALAAYNAGQGNVDKYGGVPPFKETQSYVAEIIGDVNSAGGAVV